MRIIPIGISERIRTVARVSLYCAAVLCVTWTAHADEFVDFSISPQPLETALLAFADQAGVQVAASSAGISALTTKGVSGRMTPRSALKRLVEGSNLEILSTGERSFSLLESSTRPNSTAPAGIERGPAESVQPSAPSTETSEIKKRDQHPNDARNDAVKENATAGLETVIVTAQKREERLIDTPLSVTVLSSEVLTKLGAVQFRDFASAVPGLSFSTAGTGNTQIALRGVTTGYDVGPTVATYIDEMPVGSSTVFALNAQFGLDAALFDLDRIEVLRGPQGTLYGASSMGGLIKYVTNQPDMAEFGGNLRTGLSGTHNGGVNYQVEGTFNAPVVPKKLALRASVFESHDGGYIDNMALGRQDVNNSDVYGARLSLLFTPTDALSVRLNALLQNISRDGEGTADYTFAGAQPYGDLEQYRRLAEPFDQRLRLVSGTLTYDMDRMSLTSISSYQTARTSFFADISAQYVPQLSFFGLGDYSAVGYANPLSTDKFVQEVRLASRQGERRPFDWVIGGFYTHETSENDQQFVLRDLADAPAQNTIYFISRPSRYEELAGFGNLTWYLTDQLDVTVGLRYARNDQKFEQIGSGVLGFSLPTHSSSEDVFTYLGNARYRFGDRATAYLRYATGYRPGGPNVLTIAGGAETFEADQLTSYEAGVKIETENARVGLDLSGYYIDWNDIQLLVIRNGFGTYANDPDGATILGAELALTTRPSSALTVMGTVAYQDAQMNEANADLGAAKGERLPNVPRFTATLNTEYAFSNQQLQPTIGVTLRHVGKRNASFDDSEGYPQYRLPDYTTVGLSAGLVFGRISTQLYVHNLLDERGQQSIILPQFGARVALLQPRTVGVTVITRF